MILHSHGWAGSRSTSGMAAWTDAGFGVLSFDQRGHGETGGEANVEDPDLEGQDVSSVIDDVATLDWVLLDGPGDPVLGAIGGSYGGGYQTIGALTEVRDTGSTRFNALAPEITWNDLPRCLAPNGVPRTSGTSCCTRWARRTCRPGSTRPSRSAPRRPRSRTARSPGSRT